MSSDHSSSTSLKDLLESIDAMTAEIPRDHTVATILVRDRDIWNGSEPIQLPEPKDPKASRRYTMTFEIDVEGNVLVGPVREDRDIWNDAMQLPPDRGRRHRHNESDLSPEG